MTKAYVSEYASAVVAPGGLLVPAGNEPSLAVQVVSFTTATASSAFGTETRFIRVQVDGVCSFRVSSTGAAATTSYARMADESTEFFGVPPGYYISFIDNT